MDSTARRLPPAAVVALAGVCAALHIGKLPPAIDALQQALGLTLVQAGFLLSLVQGAGMTLGIAFGVLADGLGLRRSMLAGLSVLAVASAFGAAAQGVGALMALRALEGLGFLLVVLPAPGLVRRLEPPQRVNLLLGLWGAYMPFAAALALLVGPLWIGAWGWRSWWLGLAASSAAMALWLVLGVPPDPPRHAASATAAPWRARLARTLGRRGPWLLALSFATYSSQWLAVIGFLPTIVAQAGVSAGAVGVLTALAAAVNMVGNIVSGRRLQRGAAPARQLAAGFVVMAAASALAFGGAADSAAPAALRYAAVLAFSMVGGMIPATLFALAMRVAPDDDTVSTTVGWMQQWSSFGQFAGPPLVAWVAASAGGWQWTWIATGAASAAGLLLTSALARLLAAAPANAVQSRR